MVTQDAQGNLHDSNDGRFAQKPRTAAAGTLDAELAPDELLALLASEHEPTHDQRLAIAKAYADLGGLDFNAIEAVAIRRFLQEAPHSVGSKLHQFVDAHEAISAANHLLAAKLRTAGDPEARWADVRGFLEARFRGKLPGWMYTTAVRQGRQLSPNITGVANLGREHAAEGHRKDSLDAFELRHGRGPNRSEYEQLLLRSREESRPAGTRVPMSWVEARMDIFDGKAIDPYDRSAASIEAADLSNTLVAPETQDARGTGYDAVTRDIERAGGTARARRLAMASFWAAGAASDDRIPTTVALGADRAKTVRAAGHRVDFDATLRAWSQDGEETPGLRVVLAPFGGLQRLRVDQRDAVVDNLLRAGGRARELWEQAIRT